MDHNIGDVIEEFVCCLVSVSSKEGGEMKTASTRKPTLAPAARAARLSVSDLCCALLMSMVLFAGCVSQAPLTPQATETAAVQTATPSATPPDIASLLSDRCEQPWEDTPDFKYPIEYIERYDENGCKLPVFSPDRTYLAYVTLARDQEQETYVDTVRLVRSDTGEDFVVFVAGQLCPVDGLEWSPTGQLVFREALWEDGEIAFIVDPASRSVAGAMRLDGGGLLQWNAERTAVYGAYSGIFGADVCIHDLGGYDFAHARRFPDFYAIYGLPTEDDVFGMVYPVGDALSVEPYGWDEDGTLLWVTVTPLTLDENTYDYELAPRQAGVLTFSDDGITFLTLAADPRFDYSFDGLPHPKIVSQAYHPRRCP